MTRDIIYGVLGFLLGVVGGAIIVGFTDPSVNNGSFDIYIIIVATVFCTIAGVVIAKKLNAAHFSGPPAGANKMSLTANLLLTFGLIIIPNWVLESLFGANVAIAYCVVVAVGCLIFYYRKRA